MQWESNWGGKASQAMFKAYFEDHGVPHPNLLSKPPLRGDCIKYLDAFRLLSGSRLWDQVGPKAIPVTEIEAYLRLSGVVDPETSMKYLRLIRRMDLAELQILNQRLDRTRAPKRGSNDHSTAQRRP